MLCPYLVVLFAGLAVVMGQNEGPAHWMANGRDDLNKAWARVPNYKVAKNLVLMIGDGMSLPTIAAGRIFKGQLKGQSGEEYKLSFEDFPYVALSKTYNVDRQVSDSAGTAVAMNTGIKVNIGTLGVSSEVPYGKDCSALTEARKLKTVLDYALEEGKSVGIVTNTRITHATPGAVYAHVPWRDFESDTDMKDAQNCQNVKDIASQLVMDNPNIQVLLGGGRRSFLNNTTPDPGTNQIDSHQREDGLDLTQEWKKEKAQRGVSYKYVQTKGEFDAVDPASTDYLFGLFSKSHMSYEVDRSNEPSGQPSLTEMTEKAIKILSRNPKGYYLLIEGGRIDHAHHDALGKKALIEMDQFDEAAKKVAELTSPTDTLTVITADHSHVFTISGYPSRGNDILGTVDIVVPNEAPFDGMPYLTLGYTNGPKTVREDYTNMDTTGNDFVQPAHVGMMWETHGGEEVSIYAQGPMAHMFHTTHEQSYVGHVLMYSACLGPYKNNCDMPKRQRAEDVSCGGVKPVSSSLAGFVLLGAIVLHFTRNDC